MKDRPALRMIQEGIASGQLTPGKVILDATSGNTGIAYAMMGAAMGYSVTLCVPENVTPERKRILRAYGAELVFTNPLEGSDGAIRTAQQMHDANPGKYFYADQYNNAFNWRSHYDTTGPGDHPPDRRTAHALRRRSRHERHVRRRRAGGLREFNERIVLASVQPDSPLHGLEGLKHMESAIVPGIYDPTLADEDVRVGTEEAYDMTRRLAQEEGLLVGISSGANLAGALKVAREDAVDGGGVLRRRRALPVGALLGEPARRRAHRRHELMALVLTPQQLMRRFGRTGGTPSRTSAAARCSAATAWCGKRSRCRTPPKKARGAASWCGPMITASRRQRAREARARPARLLSFASRSPGEAVAIRSRSRVAVVLLRDRVGDGWARRALDVVATEGRSLGV